MPSRRATSSRPIALPPGLRCELAELMDQLGELVTVTRILDLTREPIELVSVIALDQHPNLIHAQPPCNKLVNAGRAPGGRRTFRALG